ncbi:MAG: 4'-phosphopantetheinyl transferase superfamily protein [Xanthomonadales bacterium]|nr:4'-phosphopantetheinyl transferase superfamily protein [Xanthomonadales bacterium]
MSIHQVTVCQPRELPLGDLLLPAAKTLDIWLLDIDSSAFALTIDQGKPNHRAVNDQRRFARRFYTRLILAAYLNQPPAEIELHKSAAGKPQLLPLVQPPLHFNLSHSRQWLAIAIATDQALGIDIEFQRLSRNPLALAERYFSNQEQDWLKQQAESELQLAFNRLWVRKEAALKCIGTGLAGNLETTVCSLSQLQNNFPDVKQQDTVTLRLNNLKAIDLNILNWEPEHLDIQAAIAVQQLPESVNWYQLKCAR